MMTFLGVPIFEWAGLALALALGVEAWRTIRRKPPGPDDDGDRAGNREGDRDGDGDGNGEGSPPTDRDA